MEHRTDVFLQPKGHIWDPAGSTLLVRVTCCSSELHVYQGTPCIYLTSAPGSILGTCWRKSAEFTRRHTGLSPQRCWLEEERREEQTQSSRSGSPGRTRARAGWAGGSAPSPRHYPSSLPPAQGPPRLPVTRGTDSEPDAGFLSSSGGSSGREVSAVPREKVPGGGGTSRLRAPSPGWGEHKHTFSGGCS